ncbi:MMPL family transporter [Paenibacillus hamazuiensis]|uniref:MMPL family transporter n=1 Tax=Paenibacillus hamazuiensis TaxID=2936508 RepID=UPI00200FD293|nr:MMPL family transporter [Paenibacillus hamazuiensis]
MSKRSLTVKVAKWSAHHPWLAIFGWILFIALCVAAGKMTGTNMTEPKDFWVGEAGRAESILTSGDLMPPSVEKILITSRDGAPNAPSASAAAEEISRRMKDLPVVEKVETPIRSADENAIMVAVTLKKEYRAKDHVHALQDQTEAVQAAYPDLYIDQTGDGSISQGNEKALGGGLKRAEMITLPITLIILFVVFGSLLVAGVPLVLALTSIVASMGLYGAASYVFPDAGGAVTNMVLMIGLAVGVDYSLFFVKRVREEHERAGGRISHAAAVEIAAATSGKAILVSGFAVLVSLVGLYVADDVIFSSIATGSILVVMVAMISSLTVLPALLVKLGRRVAGRSGIKFRGKTRSSASVPLLPIVLKPVMRRPLLTFLAATSAMVILSLPAFNIELKVEGKETFPRSIPAMATYDKLTRTFPAEGVSHWVAVQSNPAYSDKVVAALNGLAEQVRYDPLFAESGHLKIRTSEGGGVSLLELPIPYNASSKEATASLEKLRNELVPKAIGQIPGAEYAVSGETARSADTVDHLIRNLPLVAGFVLLLSFIVMLFAFRSVVIGFIGITLNVLSAASTLGALVIVFQYNWLESLGLSGGGFVSSRIPLILFVILFGLSMDYQVFVVSRIREEALSGLTTREAVFRGITGSATVVTSAAVLMISVFLSFMFVPYLELKEMGFGLAIAVLLDAVIVRILILPSVMTLLGYANWWPSSQIGKRMSAQTKAG